MCFKNLLAALSTLSFLIISATAEPQHDVPIYDKPLGIALEEWPYPYSVKFLSLVIETEPLQMAYMDIAPAAQPKGHVVVLLHGKNFSGYYWDETIRALSAKGYRVVVPDQLGFGKSAKPDIHYSFDLLAENTARLLDTLNVQKAAVVGHSMGGMLAVRFARNYPSRVTCLVLENPIGLEDYRFYVPAQPTDKVFELELARSAGEYRQYVKSYFPVWKTEYERIVEIFARVRLSGEYPRWAKASALTSQMIYQQPVRQEFSLIKVPTLLVIGQADRTAVGRRSAPPETAKLLGNYPELGKAAARDIPGARLVELNNVGHIPHLEVPEKFNGALLEFVDESARQ